MKIVIRALMGITLGAALMLGCVHIGLAFADTPSDAGVAIASSGSATPIAVPYSDRLSNPMIDPFGAWNDFEAARKTSWVLGVFAALVMITKGLAYGKNALQAVPLLGRLAKWLAVGRRAIAVSGLGTIVAAGYDVLVAGGTWVAAVIACSIAAAGLMSPHHPPSS